MEREFELTIVERTGGFEQGGTIELVASGPLGPQMTDVEALITIILLTFLGVVFSLSPTGRALFDWIDNLGAGQVGNGRVTTGSAGGGGGAEFTIENR